MKLICVTALTALVFGQVSASSSQTHVSVTPIGPGTASGLPFTLSFDTTASPSLLSALSSLISSESTAINPFTSNSFSATATGASVTGLSTPTATVLTTTQNITTTAPTSTSTGTNGARRAVGVGGSVLAGVVVAVAALL